MRRLKNKQADFGTGANAGKEIKQACEVNFKVPGVSGKASLRKECLN